MACASQRVVFDSIPGVRPAANTRTARFSCQRLTGVGASQTADSEVCIHHVGDVGRASFVWDGSTVGSPANERTACAQNGDRKEGRLSMSLPNSVFRQVLASCIAALALTVAACARRDKCRREILCTVGHRPRWAWQPIPVGVREPAHTQGDARRGLDHGRRKPPSSVRSCRGAVRRVARTNRLSRGPRCA